MTIVPYIPLFLTSYLFVQSLSSYPFLRLHLSVASLSLLFLSLLHYRFQPFFSPHSFYRPPVRPPSSLPDSDFATICHEGMMVRVSAERDCRPNIIASFSFSIIASFSPSFSLPLRSRHIYIFYPSSSIGRSANLITPV